MSYIDEIFQLALSKSAKYDTLGPMSRRHSPAMLRGAAGCRKGMFWAPNVNQRPIPQLKPSSVPCQRCVELALCLVWTEESNHQRCGEGTTDSQNQVHIACGSTRVAVHNVVSFATKLPSFWPCVHQ